MDIVIREATIWDCPKIVGIYLSNAPWKDTPHETYLTVGPWGLEETCAIHINNLKRYGGIALVAELDGKIAGEAEVFISDEVWNGELVKTAHLSVIEVARWYQGKGVGRALMEHVTHLARENGCELLTVTPEKKAVGFYRKLGFSRKVFDGVLVDVSPLEERPEMNVRVYTPDWEDIRGLPMVLGQFQSSYNQWFSEFIDRVHDVDRMVYFESGKVGDGFYALEGSFFERDIVTGYLWGWEPLEGLAAMSSLAREKGFRALRTTVEKGLISGALGLSIKPLDEVFILAKRL